jgi:hypothetical protein
MISVICRGFDCLADDLDDFAPSFGLFAPGFDYLASYSDDLAA